MSRIYNDGYSREEITEYYGMSDNQVHTIRRSDNDNIRKMASQNPDKITHPDNGTELTFDREYTTARNGETLCTVYKDRNGAEYSYIKEPGQSVESQINADQREAAEKRRAGQSNGNKPTAEEMKSSIRESQSSGYERKEQTEEFRVSNEYEQRNENSMRR